MVLDDRDDGNYVIPNIDTVVVGGTHQYADWDTVASNILLFGQMRRNLLKNMPKGLKVAKEDQRLIGSMVNGLNGR